MRLSARSLINYNNVNSFDYADQWTIRAGEPNILYFQLVDLDKRDGGKPVRYVPGVGSSNQPYGVSVTFPSIDNTKVIQTTATQDANDPSIWSVSLSSVQTPNSGDVRFAVTQGTVIRNFSVMNLISVEYPNNGSDGSIPDANVNTFNPGFGG